MGNELGLGLTPNDISRRSNNHSKESQRFPEWFSAPKNQKYTLAAANTQR